MHVEVGIRSNWSLSACRCSKQAPFCANGRSARRGASAMTAAAREAIEAAGVGKERGRERKWLRKLDKAVSRGK